MNNRAAKSGYDNEGFHAHLYLSGDPSASTRPKQWEADYYSPKIARVLNKKKGKWKTAKTRQVLQTTTDAKRPVQLTLDFSLETAFRFLAEQWHDATEHMSNINNAIVHPAYQQIIGMGKAAAEKIVPLLLKELEQRPDHWFWALKEITKQDPAQAEDTFDGAVVAWLNWGRRQRYFI